MLAQNKLLAKTLETLTITLSNLPQQLHAVQPSPSPIMHIGGATYMVVLMSQACAWLKTTHLTKSTTWEVRIVKDSIKEDRQGSIREEISLTAKDRDLIQGITSTNEVHPIGLPTKGPIYMRELPSWKTH
ncbi:hypothetical protein HKD37_04G010015 [Glycine soja]